MIKTKIAGLTGCLYLVLGWTLAGAQPPARVVVGHHAAAPPPGLLAAVKAMRAGYALTTGPLILDDFEASFALTDPGFTETSPHGPKLTRQEWTKSLLKLLPDLGPMGQITNTTGPVHWQNGSAVVDFTQDLKTVLHHRGHKQKFEEISTSRDTWRSFGNTWKIHNSQSLSERDYVDGKLVYELK